MRPIIFITLAAWNFYACASPSRPSCQDTIKAEVKSSDGKYTAAVFERDCGATTDFSTIVNLRPSADAFDGDGGVIFIAKGQQQVNLVWNDAQDLRIECVECRSKDVFKQEKIWRDISVSY